MAKGAVQTCLRAVRDAEEQMKNPPALWPNTEQRVAGGKYAGTVRKLGRQQLLLRLNVQPSAEKRALWSHMVKCTRAGQQRDRHVCYKQQKRRCSNTINFQLH